MIKENNLEKSFEKSANKPMSIKESLLSDGDHLDSEMVLERVDSMQGIHNDLNQSFRNEGFKNIVFRLEKFDFRIPKG